MNETRIIKCRHFKILFFTTIVLLYNPTYPQDTTLFLTYNLLKFNEQSSNRTPYFKTIIDSLQPDILVCQEMVSQAAFDLFYVEVMDTTYAQGEYIDGPDTDNVIFFKNRKFEYLSNTPIPTELRNISEFKIVHIESKDTLIIFSVHLKAGNTSSDRTKRAEEVSILRNRTNQLKPTDYFIVCGDFNIYSSNEQAYNILLADDNAKSGHFNDPITLEGSWNNPDYAPYHTQSTRSRQFGGGAYGGLDDRFDLILFSESTEQQGGITYIDNSTWPVGNDGSHYKDSINAPPNTAVSQVIANSLHYASDHLPVIAEFIFENRTIEVPLEKGWNGISLPFAPTNTDLDLISATIGDDFVILTNLEGAYYPAGGITTITDWEYTKGYYLKTTDSTSLTIQGKILKNTQIEIKEGWNLIPVISNEPVEIATLFFENMNNVIIIKEAIGSKVFWPTMQITTLQLLEPNKSYLVKSVADFSIIYY